MPSQEIYISEKEQEIWNRVRDFAIASGLSISGPPFPRESRSISRSPEACLRQNTPSQPGNCWRPSDRATPSTFAEAWAKLR